MFKNMKLRYSNKYVALLTGLLIFNSCGQDLEVTPIAKELEVTYYQDRTEAYAGLVAVYDVLGFMDGLITKVGATNSASDDHIAGGGGPTDMNAYQVWSNYTLTPAVGPQEALWKKSYSGIFRANTLLEKLPGVPMDEQEKKRFTAETKFLRAHFYFDAVRLFKNIPLITKPVSANEMFDILQAAPADVYTQIETDLKEAIVDLPATVTGEEAARATSGAAHALLGKVYLYQDKFSDAATELAIVNGPTPGAPTPVYGYDLEDNFGDLFKQTNEFNKESIFEVSFTNTSNAVWDCAQCGEGNIVVQMAGPRNFQLTAAGVTAGVPEYSAGWSFFIPTPDLINAMTGDPRYDATIVDIGQLVADGKATYTKGYMDNGYFMEKLSPKTSEKGPGTYEINWPNNLYEIRLADTYLMEAEALVRGGGNATRAQDLLDAVRARVGLGSIPATFDNIFNERRLELAGEGHRWFDLVRTGKAAAALASKGFVAGKHEILPIPQLDLENTSLVQSKEWGGTK
jgi:hypothetical protein